jgi:hypothetical protein
VDSGSTHGTVRLEFGTFRAFAEASTKNPPNNDFGGRGKVTLRRCSGRYAILTFAEQCYWYFCFGVLLKACVNSTQTHCRPQIRPTHPNYADAFLHCAARPWSSSPYHERASLPPLLHPRTHAAALTTKAAYFISFPGRLSHRFAFFEELDQGNLKSR